MEDSTHFVAELGSDPWLRAEEPSDLEHFGDCD